MTREERIKRREELNTKENIIKMFQENKIAIDDHDAKEKTITGLVEFNNSSKELAACVIGSYYSLNAIYISDIDEKLHVSTWSIGGVLYGAYPDEEELKKYNDSVVQEGGKIKCIHLQDGSKVYPEGEEPTDDANKETKNQLTRNPKDKYLLVITMQDNSIITLSVYDYNICNNVLHIESFVDNAKESCDTHQTYIPYCNIKFIDAQSYNMLDRVSKY